MIKDERQEKILEILFKNDYVEVKSLSEIFEVSRMTIRRDLNELESGGFVYRVSGGAKLSHHKEPNYKVRMSQNKNEKKIISKLANDLLTSEELIYLGSGSTCYYLAKKIMNKKITVVTNWIPNIIELSKGNCDIINIGGKINKEELIAVNYQAIRMLKMFEFTKAFIGIGGINDKLISTYKMEVSEIDKFIINNANNTYILTDHTKFDKTAPLKILDLNDELNISVITSDVEKINENTLNEIKKKGVEVISK